MLNLQDGKLYETRDGRRFRVTKKDDGLYKCRSHDSGWFSDGSARNLNYKDYLVKETEQYRWIPVRGNTDNLKEGETYRYRRGHVQRRVTREEAQRLAPNYKQPQPDPIIKIDTLMVGGAEVQVHTIENRKYIKITTIYGGEVLVAV